MTEQQLAEIAARAEQATRGPWVDEVTDDGWLVVLAAGDSFGALATLGDVSETGSHDHANARFIAAARADVPALVAEVARMRRGVAQLRALLRAIDQAALPPGAAFQVEAGAELAEELLGQAEVEGSER